MPAPLPPLYPTPEQSTLELSHTLRMLQLSLSALMLAKGTRGAKEAGGIVNAKIDDAAAATADAAQLIAAHLET
jgi:hypothetical protein